jgi:ankyrin repeat protein
LVVAARNGDMNTLKALLELGLPVDEVGQNGRTAFIHTSIPVEFDTDKLMLKVVAKIDAAGNEGRSAAHYVMLGCATGRSAVRFADFAV